MLQLHCRRRRGNQRLQGQRLWLGLGLAVVVVGLWLGGELLAAIGALPPLATLLPCLAMCALGRCVRGGAGGSCEQQPGNLLR